MRSSLYLTGVFALVVTVSQTASAETAVFAQLAADGQVKFETAEDLVVNDNRKIKLAPEAAARLDPIEAKSLQRAEAGHAGLLRGDGKGRLFRVNPDGSTDRVIPETFSLKLSIQAATTPIPLTLKLFRNKKDKNATEVPAAKFYLYVPAPDPERATLGFVLNAKNFGGMDEQLRVIEAFARSFQSAPVAVDLRRSLRRQVQSAQDRYDEGGTFESLLETQKVAFMAHRVFESDVDLTEVAGEITERIHSTQETGRMLLALADAEDWGTFRTVYRKIEANQDSFPRLRALRRRALEEETRQRCERARALIVRHQDSAALDELSAAALLDPENREIPKLAESTRMLAAKQATKQADTARTALAKDSPEERRFRQALYNADRAIQDHDFQRAQDSIRDAEHEDAAAPQILLAKASLAAETDDIPKAIPLLDQYDRTVTDSADREKGDGVRNQVLYELRKRKQESKAGIESSLKEGDYQRAYKESVSALRFEQTNTDFLYSAGLSAAVLRKEIEAKGYFESYLQYSDNLASSDPMRSQARKLTRILDQQPVAESKTGLPNWLSGRPLSQDIYYCPTSLAFQPPIESISGFKFRINYDWAGGRLRSIHTDFEDEKGKQDYLLIASKSTRISGESKLGNFSFVYQGDRPTVQAVYAGAAPIELSREGDVKLLRNDDKSYKVVDKSGNPLVVLENNPWFDLKIVGELLGPVATIISGNSFFNPFIWDGVHYFTASYDEQGRTSSAKEWNANNIVRFHWDGDRLTEVDAYHAGEREPYYRREISYAGPNIIAEDYKSGGHGGRIRYSYQKDALIAKMEDTGVYDGKTWIVRIADRK